MLSIMIESFGMGAGTLILRAGGDPGSGFQLITQRQMASPSPSLSFSVGKVRIAARG